MKNETVAGAIFGGLVFGFACVFGLGELLISSHDQHVRDHAFEVGKGIGSTLTGCDDFDEMRVAKAGSEWAQSNATLDAVATCKEFRQLYDHKTYSEILNQP